MFCRKCGSQIPDDSIFCLKCGTKVEVFESNVQQEQVKESGMIVSEETDDAFNRIETPAATENKKAAYRIYGVIVAVFIIMIIVIVFGNSGKCAFESCDNSKIQDSEYCYSHTCEADGCTNSKSKYEKYCYTHEKELCCAAENCGKDKIEGGEYCYSHTCEKSDCYNKKFSDTNYCLDHQIDMRKKITSSSFYFSLNSAGGIKFNFKARNSTGKEIKYIRFDVALRNAVGDLVTDEIKRTSSVSVEIVGPIKSGSLFSMSDEIIGYCDTCARIDIDDITIIYMDGTSETGHFGYYYEK